MVWTGPRPPSSFVVGRYPPPFPRLERVALAKKSDFVARLIQEVQPRHPIPTGPKEGFSLLEQGAVMVLMRHLTQTQAEASVASLRAGIGDWNEARVCQAQELAQYIKTSSRKKGMELLNSRAPAARELKDYLQDVFQETHSLDLEFFREESTEVGEVIESFKVLDMPSTAYLFWLATNGQLTVHSGLLKLLDRLGLIPRTTSLVKGRSSIESLVPEKDRYAFNLAIHEVLAHWNDEKEPSYVTYEVLRSLPYGKKAYEDREAALKREAAARKKEEAREALAAKREAERLAKEQEKERKRQEQVAAREQREREKQERIAARKAAQEAKKKEAAAKAEAAKKAREEKRVADAKAKAEAKKKAEAAKKTAAKKAAAKKAAAKKAASKKKASKKKPATKKKPAAKKAAKKKSTAKKASSKKSAGKKGTTKKSASKKASKKTTKKKSTKSTKKKTTKKKSSKRSR